MTAREFLFLMMEQQKRTEKARQRFYEAMEDNGVSAVRWTGKTDGGNCQPSSVERVNEEREAAYGAYLKSYVEWLEFRSVAERLFSNLSWDDRMTMGRHFMGDKPANARGKAVRRIMEKLDRVAFVHVDQVTGKRWTIEAQ